MVVMFGLVAPRLISFDLRSRAYLLYFSRPLSVAEYLIGKGLVLVALLGCTSTIPALFVYLAGLGFSPDPWTIAATWDLPLRILVASLTLAIPTASLAILYSSFTSESRYAAFAWFATWGLGWVSYLVLNSVNVINNQSAVLPRYIDLISPYHTLGLVQSVVFGTLPDPAEGQSAIVLVTVVTCCAILVSYYRVAAQLRL
jgi:ABC-type transport system involved in multi-copper enzyme maturation permease subunit